MDVTSSHAIVLESGMLITIMPEPAGTPRMRSWLDTVGMFADDPDFEEMVEAGRAIREADRQAAREEAAARGFMIVLDTDHLSELERRGSAKGGKLFQRLQLQSDPIVATVVSIEEQFRGRLAAINRIAGRPEAGPSVLDN